MRSRCALFATLCLAATLGLRADRLSADLPSAGVFTCDLSPETSSIEIIRQNRRTSLPVSGQARLRLESGSLSVLQLGASIALPGGGALDLSADPAALASSPLTPFFSGVTVPLRAILRQAAGGEPLPFDAHLTGTLSAQTTFKVGGFLPAKLPRLGGKPFLLPMSCSTVPTSELVPDTGLTSYGTYVGSSVGGQSALADVMTGNFILDPVDLEIPGRGLSLSLERTYNAHDALGGESGVFGRGWSSLLDARVETVMLGGRYLFRDASGASYIFEPTTRFGLRTTVYTALGLHAVLFHRGGVTVAYEDGTTLRFRSTTLLSAPEFLLTSIEDRRGNRISIVRNAEGRPQQIVDSLGRKVELQLDAGGRVARVHPPSPLASISYEYDSAGLLRRVARGSKVTSYRYNSNSLMTDTTDPRGFMTRFSYDVGGECSGHIRTIAYAREAGDKPAMFDTYSFSTCSAGEASVTDPNGHKTSYRWDPTIDPAPTKIIDPLGRETRSEVSYPFFDLSLQANSEQTLEWEYDFSDGRLLTFTQTFREGASPLVTEYRYADRPLDCSPDRELACFLDGLLLRSVTDPEGNTSRFEYEEGQLAKLVDPLGHETSFTYASPGGSLDAIIRPRGTSRLDWIYDASGNLVEVNVSNPLGRRTTTRFDAAGRRSELIAADGTRTSYENDGLSRLTAVRFGDGETVSFTYDDNDNLLTLTDATGTTIYAYDHRDRRVLDILPDGATIAYDYDGVGNLRIKTDRGGSIEYEYDKGDRLTALTQPDGTKVVYSEFDGNDNPRLVRYPNGMSLARRWDGAGRLKKLTATAADPAPFALPPGIFLVAASYDYTYTRADLSLPLESTRLRRSTNAAGDVSEYSYDPLGQLVGVVTRFKNGLTGYRAWSYDGNGNRRRQVLGPPARQVVTEYRYDQGDQLLQALAPCPRLDPSCNDPFRPVTAVGYAWNDTGDLLSRSDGLRLEYDAALRTTAITPPTGAAEKLTFTYSGLDQTLRVGVRQGNGEETAFTYDLTGIGPAAQEAGNPGSEPIYYTRTPDGELVSLRRGARTFYYVTDRLGSVLALVGRVREGFTFRAAAVNRYEYDPWGKVLTESELPAARQPFRFASAELDGPTGLYKMGTRYYDPALGRFTQPDPLGSLTSYAYVGNDPVNLVDPDGLEPKGPGGGSSSLDTLIKKGGGSLKGKGKAEIQIEQVKLTVTFDVDLTFKTGTKKEGGKKKQK